MEKKRKNTKKIFCELVISHDDKLKSSLINILDRREYRYLPLIMRLKSFVEEMVYDVIILRIKNPNDLSWSKAHNIRSLLSEAKEKGKQIYVFLEMPGNKEYYIASIADKIILTPYDLLNINGFYMEVGFLKGLFDKIGIEADFEKIGNYKSFPEQFTEEGMTKYQRESLEQLFNDYYSIYVDGISEGRKLLKNEVEKLLDNGPLSAKKSVSASLVDKLLYYDELKDFIKEDLDVNKFIKMPLEEYEGYKTFKRIFTKKKKIGFLRINGNIVLGKSKNKNVAGSDNICNSLKSMRRRKNLVGAVIVVESVGGSAIASDYIRREIFKLNEEKPVVVFMLDIAASGGYYVSIPATKILSSPFAIIGSIGVLAGKFVLKGFLDRLGINFSSVKIGKNSDIFSPLQKFDDEKRKVLKEELLEYFYDAFIEEVAGARNRTKEEIDNIAQGRIWSGLKAMEHRLTDELSGLESAFTSVLELNSLPKDTSFRVVQYPKKKWSLSLINMLDIRNQSKIGKLLNLFISMDILSREEVLYLSHFEIDFH